MHFARVEEDEEIPFRPHALAPPLQRRQLWEERERETGHGRARGGSGLSAAVSIPPPEKLARGEPEGVSKCGMEGKPG